MWSYIRCIHNSAMALVFIICQPSEETSYSGVGVAIPTYLGACCILGTLCSATLQNSFGSNTLEWYTTFWIVMLWELWWSQLHTVKVKQTIILLLLFVIFCISANSHIKLFIIWLVWCKKSVFIWLKNHLIQAQKLFSKKCECFH